MEQFTGTINGFMVRRGSVDGSVSISARITKSRK
jgi:hypothetical protein